MAALGEKRHGRVDLHFAPHAIEIDGVGQRGGANNDARQMEPVIRLLVGRFAAWRTMRPILAAPATILQGPPDTLSIKAS